MRSASVLGVLLAAVLVAGCQKPLNPYPPEVIAAFMDRCAAQAPKGACECTLDELRRKYTYEQFSALEQRTRETRKPAQEFQDAANACR